MAITTDLVSYWPLEASGNDAIGPYNPSAITGVSFVTDGALQVSEFSSGQIRYDPAMIDGITTNFTFQAWVKLTTLPTGGSYLLTNAYSGATYPSVQVYIFDTGVVRFQFYTSNTAGGAQTLDGPTLSTGTWYHLAFTYDGSTMTIFQNGSSVATLSTSGSPFTNGYSVSVGSYRPYASGYFVDGRAWDMALWHRALTAAEVLQIYNAGAANNRLSSLFPMTANLVSYWPFDSSTNDAFGSDNGTGTGGLAYATSMSGFSNAIDCSGSDYVTFGAPAYGTSSLTFSYWVQPAGLGAGKYQIIGDNRTGSYVGISIFCNGPNDYFRCELSSGAGYSNTYSTSVPVAGTWYHLVVVVDKVTNTQRMYVDGVLQSNASDSPSIAGYGSLTNSTYYIGTAATAGISIWEGLIDDAAWWTRALTPAEISAIHAAGAAGSPLSSFIPADADLMGQFSSVVHSVAAADADLSGQFASIVHSVAAQNADLSGQFASIVHSATAATRADLEGQFASIVHSVAAANADLSGQFVSVVHSSTAAPSGGGGPPGQGGSLQGYLLQGGVLEGDF